MSPDHTIRLFKPDALRPPRDFVLPAVSWTTEKHILEIGAGAGRHALQLAQAYPDTHIWAVERTRNKFEAFAKAAYQNASPYLHPIHADVIPWCVFAVPPAVLDQVFILYPNPEPHNPAQRWLNMPFFAFLLSRMKPEATLTLASNLPSYLVEAMQQADTVWHLPVQWQAIPEQARQLPRTHFEAKYLVRGEPCAQLQIIKPVGYRTAFDTWQAVI